MPVSVMRNTITNKEFFGWLSYYDMPMPDIQEVQLATLSVMVAQGLGAKNVKHEDYLVRKPEKAKPKETVALDNGLLDINEVQSVFAGIATPLDG